MKKEKFNPKMTRRQVLKAGMIAGAGLMLPWNSVILRNAYAQQGAPLPGNKIAQFVDPLPDQHNGGLHVITAGATQIELSMEEFLSPVMPSTFVAANPAFNDAVTGLFKGTWKWGYRGTGQMASSYIGPIIFATRGTPTEMKFKNNLPATSAGSVLEFWKTSVDQTLHWADPIGSVGNPLLDPYAGPIPTVVHLHGGEVPPQLDGGPDAWFTRGGSYQGHAYYSYPGTGGDGSAVYRYPNSQEGANIWFHDHALGITRLNVYAGMAGAYLIQEPGLWKPSAPKPALIPLVIQDRMFDVNGQLFFPNIGINPEHPFWVPEFVGDTIVVNGKVWPYKAVDRQRYTLLFLNGSNARFYDTDLIDPVTGVKGPPMYVISTDGGYLENPVLINPNATGQQAKAGIAKSLIVGPGERYEAIVDFNDATWLANITAAYAALGQPVPNPIRLHLRNQARTPFPGGAPAQNSTTGRIMEFRVSATVPTDGSFNPAGLAALRTRSIIRLVNPVAGAPAADVTPAVTRQLTLNEAMGPGGPLEVLVNNTKWGGHSIHEVITNQNGVNINANGVRNDFTAKTNSDGTITYYSELPAEGTTELWEIINITADAHPIHLHLVQFQLMNRQAFNVAGYIAAYDALFPATQTTLDPMTGAAYPGGVFIGGYGPPSNYKNLNTDGAVGGNPAISGFLNAKKWPARPPLPSEAGWKDTVIMYPGEVTRILVRWAPTDLAANTPVANAFFPFDPNGGHGYVWHCHIIDHEDNEMMRPDAVISNPSAQRDFAKGTDY
jgi:spore coat protein A